jgi:cytosine/adenosine deaminase-related metal-dependent hydrolase
MNGKLLLRNGTVLTMDPEIGDLRHADVLVEGGRIAQVGTGLTVDAEVLDCSGKIILPGFVNSHQHMFQTALRSYWADATAADYFTQSRSGPGGIFHHYTPEDVYWGELAGALENLAAGTTTVVDTSQCSYTPDHTDAALEAVRRSGIRCVFSLTPATGDQTLPPSYAYPHDIHRLLREVTDPRIRLALGYLPDATDFRLARDLGLPVFAHVNNAWFGRVLEKLETEDLLGPWITYVHAVGLDPSTWQTIARTGGKVSVSCLIEQTLGLGRPAIRDALDHAVPVGLSADAVSLGAVDLFSQMRTAFALRRGGPPETAPISAREVLRMATLGGAEAAHVDDLVGSLTPGKKADLVVLDGRTLNAGPVNHATGAVVGLMDTSNVNTVIADGHLRKHQGRLLDVDVDDVLDHLTRSAENLLRRSGHPDILLTSCRQDG